MRAKQAIAALGESSSARRTWIEIATSTPWVISLLVVLRTEDVD